jgi:hypothetical protein
LSFAAALFKSDFTLSQSPLRREPSGVGWFITTLSAMGISFFKVVFPCHKPFLLREMKIANIPFIFENIMAYCNHDFALNLKI